jgi:MFS family permease
MFGVLIGTLGAAQISDLFGRRIVLCVSACHCPFLQTLVGLSINWQMYAVLRFLSGIFLGESSRDVTVRMHVLLLHSRRW